MSCQEELDLAETVIDSLKFASDGACLVGRLALRRLPRLSDVLTRGEGWLQCRIAGYRLERQGDTKLGLHLQVEGRLSLGCQRCLADVDFDCVIDSRLLLIAPDADWPEEELESDDFDAIPASRELSVLSLIEEEMLLALPLVPRHAECEPPAGPGLVEVNEECGKPSPFAALAKLKKH